MVPAFAAPSEPSSPTGPGATPTRMLAVCNNLGLVPEYFFPKQTGRDYTPSPYLEVLGEHRNDFTVFSGVWHPDGRRLAQAGTEPSILTWTLSRSELSGLRERDARAGYPHSK